MHIQIENLHKTYGVRSTALQGIDLEINGGVFGLLGRNGAGKTTLMRILATAIKPTTGRILFDGKELRAHTKEFRAQLGYLPQITSLMPSMNICEFLDYVCLLKRITKKSARLDEIDRLVHIVGLENETKKRLSKYSGGMLRRAGIAQALIGSPSLLIIDEPTTGLDPEERLHFLNLLSQISRTQTTLLSTHIIHDIESICPGICVLDKGNMIYTGATADMIARVEGNVWQTACAPGGEQTLKENATVVSVKYAEGKPVVRYISDHAVCDHSVQVQATLEDAYICALGGVKR